MTIYVTSFFSTLYYVTSDWYSLLLQYEILEKLVTSIPLLYAQIKGNAHSCCTFVTLKSLNQFKTLMCIHYFKVIEPVQNRFCLIFYFLSLCFFSTISYLNYSRQSRNRRTTFTWSYLGDVNVNVNICYGWDWNFFVEIYFALNCTLRSLSNFPK